MTLRRSAVCRAAAVTFGALLLIVGGCAPPSKPASSAASRAAQGDGAVGAGEGAAKALPVTKGSDATALSSKIRKVTVYSDRARVTRQATATVGTDPTVFAFKQLPGWVDDGSVRVSTNAGRILDVQVDRTFLARATDAGFQSVEDGAQQLAGQMAALDDELEILAAQAKQIEDIKAFSLEKLTQDMTAVPSVSVDKYGSVVEFISKSLRATAKARRAVELQRTKLAPEIEAGEKHLGEMRGLTQLEETTVYVTLEAKQPAKAVLELTYMLPGATWEPMHEFRASKRNPKSVEVTSFAVVTQTSGEDWHHAEMTFSTQSTVQSVRIPELEALTLGDTKVATAMLRRQSASFTRAQTAFDAQNRLWNMRLRKTGLGSSFEQKYQDNFEYLQIVQGKTVRLFQSLQKRGTTAHFKAIDTAIVRADGHSVRLPIGRTKFSTKEKIVAAPEQSLNAARTLDMGNSSSQPLLPGQVALHQDGAFLGMTEVDFVADGERFDLFFSVADHIKLTRVLDKKHSALIRKTRTRMRLAFIVTVENLSDQNTTLTLADRIPVSEDRSIVVSRVKVTPTTKPDSKGILKWKLTLKPKEKRTFRIQYQIDYPPTLILEAQRNRARPPPPSPASSPFPGRHPFGKSKRRLADEIFEMEQAF
ncbi:MAG: mucoidy inhibitor MuiA family protein [Deltaproteobacteria bacterium]|nr:mucoidy inhibitor MuiA family protein [Deltaproteobacteria bacterium]